MDCSIIVMTCDSYSDCWLPFKTLKDRYWSNCPYKIYIVTETKNCEYFYTIKKQGAWTKRLREALQDIDTEYVLFMLEDYFIREYVDQERICNILDNFKNDEAVYDFEKAFDDKLADNHILGFGQKIDNTIYMNNTQPAVHNRLKLIERLQQDQTIWQWETTPISSPYKFYINTDEWIIDVGHRRDIKGFGVTKGKWTKECIAFFEKEGIEVNYNERGIL